MNGFVKEKPFDSESDQASSYSTQIHGERVSSMAFPKKIQE